MEYPIIKNGSVVGSAVLKPCGLYTEICCKCNNLGDGFHRIRIEFQNKMISIGVLTPKGETHALCRKVSTKSLGDGTPVFAIHTDDNGPKEMLQLISGKPFEHLDKIRKGKLLKRNEKTWLLV